MIKNFDTKTLDNILDKMIDTVSNSKDEIFRIGEQCRQDYELLTDELKDLKKKVVQTIKEGDRLDGQSRLARQRLSKVSLHFKEYSEVEVREVYEIAHQLQMALSMNRQLEKQLRDRRNELERRLVGLNETIERAEHLVSQITVVMSYLTSDLKQMGLILEDAKLKHDFSVKIIEAQEEERKRLSREMHDGPAQMMANVIIRSNLIERVYNEYGAKEAFAELNNFKQMVRDALYEVRRIIYDLRPMALDDLGLAPTLKKYLQTIEEYHNGTLITFINIGQERRLPPKYEVALFRLVQESVQNALKHAEAREVKVKLDINETSVTVLISDDGKGFDLNERKEHSFGIIGMQERVDLLGGKLSITSKIGEGTVVLIQVTITD